MGTLHFAAVHERNYWRHHTRHHTLQNALYGPKDGAPGLFSGHVRIRGNHGRPLYVVVWEEGGLSGFLARPSSSDPNGVDVVEVGIDVIRGFHSQREATPEALSALFERTPPPSSLAAIEVGVVEAERTLRLHLTRERKSRLAQAKKAQMLRRLGRLECEACLGVHEHMYSDLCDALYEVHHIDPISSETGRRRTTLDDLAVLCANCHAVIHRTCPMWSVPRLAAFVFERQAR